MNPYSRFRLVSNTVSAALIVGALATFGQGVFAAIAGSAAETGLSLWAAMGAGIGVLVVFWLAMTEAIFPSLFRFNTIRRLVLGKYYIEGTWLQAERGAPEGPRLSVIDIQPAGRGFIFSGYALNRNLEIESNTLIEFSKFEWPFMSYKYRNSLSDGADGQRDGVGEIQFEMNRSSAARYNGFAQFVKNTRRLKIEGAKLKKNAEVKRLRSLEHRKQILEKYWNLFFNVSIADAAAPNVLNRKPVIVSEAPVMDRRVSEEMAAGSVVPRRRASDWRQEDATPTISRLRAQLEQDEEEIEDEEDYDAEDEAELGAEDEDYDTDASEDEDDADIEEEYEADAEDDEEAEDEDEQVEDDVSDDDSSSISRRRRRRFA